MSEHTTVSADDVLRSLSSWLGQGLMFDTYPLNYEEVEKRIRDGVNAIIKVEVAREHGVYCPHCSPCRNVEKLIATEQQRDELAAACQWYSDNPDSPISALEHIRAALAKVKP